MKSINTKQAPVAIGPYSQAVQIGNMVFVSGQIPLDPTTQTLTVGGVASQTQQVLQNIQAIVMAAGGQLSQIVKTTIYLTDLAAFAAVNEVYGQFFTEPYPARATVQVAALPKGAQIEIDCIVML
ncbi:MAG: hypothetical protein ACD_21C00154G0001 [uncultured bacterium]|nr:MAG: hypothetical protein ACD_21C00154G0001 [uncultured bacterium]